VVVADDRQLSKIIARYGRVELLCLDQLGYMDLDRRCVELLFQVLSEREERSAIASNEPFSGWTKTFTDPRLCAVIVVRLTFAGQIIETGTTSYGLATPARGAPPADNDQRRWRREPVQSWDMLVSDLNHFLDLPQDRPGPARRLAGHLSDIVRAATAGDAGTAWESALPCRRRPANRRCPGRMIVARTEAGAPIRWQCSVCDDEGMISNWEDSAFDLRRRQLTLAEDASEIAIPHEVAAALRDLQLLDIDCERLVFAIRARNDHSILAAIRDDLDDLLGFVAAEANNEPSRRRQQRLDAAFDALTAAAGTPGGW